MDMDDCFVSYSPPMERVAYGKSAPRVDDRFQDEPVMMDALSHPGRPRLSDPAQFAWPDRPAKAAEPTGSLYDFATTTPPEKGAMHAAYRTFARSSSSQRRADIALLSQPPEKQASTCG